jgi:hypothetical protein
MAEVVGLAASICTLSGCIKKVGDIASDLKNYGDKLESLNKALAGVELARNYSTLTLIRLHTHQL